MTAAAVHRACGHNSGAILGSNRTKHLMRDAPILFRRVFSKFPNTPAARNRYSYAVIGFAMPTAPVKNSFDC